MAQRTSRAGLIALVVVALFYAAALPVVFSTNIAEGRAAADHLNYHEPVVHAFTEEWPRPDFSNYHSATTPLYHLILAGARVAFDPSRRGLMLLASAFTAGLLVVLVLALPGTNPQRLALALPIVGSMYVLFPGIWLLPDNAAWLGVLGIIVLAMRARRLATLCIAGSVMLLALVLTRQIHLWTAGVLWAAAWLGSSEAESESDSPAAPLPSPITLVRELFTCVPARLIRLACVVLATLPATLALVYFLRLWDGLIVPRYQSIYHGWNLATPAFFLAIIGSFAPFYAAYAWTGLKRLAVSRALLGVLVVAAVCLVIIPTTTYDVDAGRKSGLWNLVKTVPTIAGHTSPVLLVLAPVGMVLVAGLLAQVPRRAGWILLGAITGFVAAQTLSPELWQRYHEPFILIMLALLCAHARHGSDSRALNVVRMLGPVLLAVALGVLSAYTILTDTPAASLRSGDFERSVEFEPLPVR